MSDIQDYVECIIKRYETLTAVLPIHVYINKINHRLVFKMRDGYKIKARIRNAWNNEIILVAKKKKKKDKTKNEEKWPSLEVAEVFSVQCNLGDNQYQQKSEVLHTFIPNKSHGYLLNVEPSNLVFLKTYNREFDEIILKFTDQNGRPLKIEDKVNLTLLINK